MVTLSLVLSLCALSASFLVFIVYGHSFKSVRRLIEDNDFRINAINDRLDGRIERLDMICFNGDGIHRKAKLRSWMHSPVEPLQPTCNGILVGYYLFKDGSFVEDPYVTTDQQFEVILGNGNNYIREIEDTDDKEE